MPVTLVDSQLATLEPPTDDENAWFIDVDASPREIVDEILKRAAT